MNESFASQPIAIRLPCRCGDKEHIVLAKPLSASDENLFTKDYLDMVTALLKRSLIDSKIEPVNMPLAYAEYVLLELFRNAYGNTPFDDTDISKWRVEWPQSYGTRIDYILKNGSTVHFQFPNLGFYTELDDLSSSEIIKCLCLPGSKDAIRHISESEANKIAKFIFFVEPCIVNENGERVYLDTLFKRIII